MTPILNKLIHLEVLDVNDQVDKKDIILQIIEWRPVLFIRRNSLIDIS